MVPGCGPVAGFAVLRPQPRRSKVMTRYPAATKPGMLYCQPSALPVLAWSSTSGTPLPPLSVYQRRTPGRSAYPANFRGRSLRRGCHQQEQRSLARVHAQERRGNEANNHQVHPIHQVSPRRQLFGAGHFLAGEILAVPCEYVLVPMAAKDSPAQAWARSLPTTQTEVDSQ